MNDQTPILKRRGRPPGYQAAPDPETQAVIDGTANGGYLVKGPYDRKSAMTFRQKLKRHGGYVGLKFSIATTVDDDLWVERVTQEG